jgi:hypothetical protein
VTRSAFIAALLLLLAPLALAAPARAAETAVTAKAPDPREANPEKPGQYSDERYLTLAPLLLSIVHHNDVQKLVTLVVTLELADRSQRVEVERLMPRLRDAYLTDLTKLFSLGLYDTRNIRLTVIKQRLRIASERVLGPGVVRDVLILNSMERAV